MYAHELDVPAPPNMHHAEVVAFAECDDPVAFLTTRPEWSLYSDSVWGGLLELLEDAKKEVEEAKVEGKAVERLRVVWGQLKSKL